MMPEEMKNLAFIVIMPSALVSLSFEDMAAF